MKALDIFGLTLAAVWIGFEFFYILQGAIGNPRYLRRVILRMVLGPFGLFLK